MAAEGSLPFSQQRATCPCPEQDISLKLILIVSSHRCISLQSGLFPTGFPTKTLYPPYVPHAPPISSSFILSPS
jgi:hypothetical protein